ncbi:DTW domain-containing protein [Undibacterium jejuense]|uniref:tRNA-uridine aminocarboxypropyltransferase n=1 Tax=Undibacterium jejuense TaxID=1344949 RepID=A0A923HIA7_9BURK|nr:tRNA-uridine aminocarboxypropyltransferase [Undibacterium jejuense]MBC3862923.1 DTW domain-containing protein [Undibacterium jejuense]
MSTGNAKFIFHASLSRQACAQCQRPLTNCICRWIKPIANLVEVLILQHPMEVNNAKGSARLLDLCLQASQIIIGENFAADELLSVLHAPSCQNPGSYALQPVLLYPDTGENQAIDLVTSTETRFQENQDPRGLRLVILDATWRKSRKMLYLNPVLQTLPRLSLTAMPASHYRIRKAHKPDQLSSLEASTYALMRLENDEEKYLPLLEAFDGFVEQQMQFMPPRK